MINFECKEADRSSGSIMRVLKEGTADLHKEIESYVPLLNPDLTLIEYYSYLANISNFYVPIEERIKEFIPRYGDVLCLSQRLKSPLLIADLEALGAHLQLTPLSHRLQQYPTIKSIEELIGVLYVVEGATLGGKIILRALKEHLKLPDEYCLFFNGYGQQTGTMWKTYGVHAERLTASSPFQETLQSARTTFNRLISCIRPLGNIGHST